MINNESIPKAYHIHEQGEGDQTLSPAHIKHTILDLEIFDLPIPIAIFVVIAWIFICSATFCIWEHDWDYFVAFYFFFISLRCVYFKIFEKIFSTIGLGDITPTQPKYLLMLFIYIIIGLSLVSMCINLIQVESII